MNNIKIQGYLKVSIKDAKTNEVLSVCEGYNQILETGLESLCFLLSGNFIIPSDLISGNLASSSNKAFENLPVYCQFGASATPPTSKDKSIFDNGTLDPNAVSPTTASDIVKSSYFYPSKNSVTLVFTLNPNQGNGVGQPEGVAYREAVLMSKTQDNPPKYKWFSRKVFGDRIKKSDTILEGEWTFTFFGE